MKAMKKVLALGLALAMVVTAVPVTSAEAATAKLTAGKTISKTYYVGKTNTLQLSGVTASKVKSTTWSKSNAKVTLSSKTKTSAKVKAVKAGTATVTAKVTMKSGAKKTYKCKITVKNPTITAASASTVAVGEKVSVKATGVKPASATVEYSVADSTIATVDAKTGEVTGVKEGTTTVTAKLTCGTTVKEVTTDVTVKNVVLQSVKQTETTKLVATVAGNTASLKPSDFVITNTYSKANVAVKSVSIDSTDETQVTVETYVAMKDGKDYTVTLTDVTKTITATDAKIVSATITPATVIVPTPAAAADGSNVNDIKIAFTDANGVLVATLGATDTTLDGFAYVETKVDATNNGYMSVNTLNLYKAGNTAKVTVVAHTGKYDTAAQEVGNVTAEATITGVDAPVVTTTGYTTKLVNGTTTATAFKDVKETKVAVGDSTITAYIQKNTSDNKVAKVDTGFTFESSNVDVMTVSTGADITDATAVTVKAYKEGTAYIIVRDAKANVVATLPITIGAKRKAVSLSLDKTSFVFSDKTKDDVTVKATAKDQYGEDFTIDALTVAKADGNAVTATITEPSVTIEKANLGADDTTTAYVVKFGDLKAAFTVQITKAGDTANYDLVLDATTADAVVKADATANTVITAKVQGFDAKGIVSEDNVTGYTFKVTKDGKDVTNDAAGAISGGTINVNNLSNGKQMATGTYVITATSSDSKKVFTKTFTITNSQPVATAVLTATEVNASDSKKLQDILKVTYDGKELTSSDYVVDGDAAITTTKNFAEITLVINVGTHKVQQVITLGKTVVAK